MVLPRVSDEILNYNGTHCTVILRHISKHSMLSFINQNDPVKKICLISILVSISNVCHLAVSEIS